MLITIRVILTGWFPLEFVTLPNGGLRPRRNNTGYNEPVPTCKGTKMLKKLKAIFTLNTTDINNVMDITADLDELPSFSTI